MRPKLEWRTEEDEIAAQLEPDLGLPSAPKRAVLVLVVLALTSVLTIVLVAQVGRRQANVLAEVQRDVMLAFDLQQEAVLTGDKELYSLTLSPNDRTWRGFQEMLFEDGFFADQASGADSRLAEPQVVLSPDLKTAEVTYEQTRIVELGQPATDLELQHTAVFKLEDGRWLQSIPEPSFWGAWQTFDGDHVTVAYPEKDAELAKRLAVDINVAIAQMCADMEAKGLPGQGFCQSGTPIRLRLANEPQTLFPSEVLPSISGGQFDLQLPAPTLLGVPSDESDYEAYAHFYLRPLLEKLETALNSAVAFPEQAIYALCYDHPLRGQHLYRYSRTLNTWEVVIPQRPFQDMSVSPDDSSIMLANNGFVTVLTVAGDAAVGNDTATWERRLSSGLESSLVGWMKTKGMPFLLLQTSAGVGEQSRYSVLDVAGCNETSCPVFEVPGFPSLQWSGEAALFLVGSDIYLGAQDGENIYLIGKGFSPFWLDKDRYGFVRFAGEGENMTTELVVGQTGTDHLTVLLDGNDLARATGISKENVLFINQVLFEPGNAGLLLLSATGIRDYAGRYYIFTIDLNGWKQGSSKPAVTFQLEREATQGGVPGQLTPTGKGRFIVSSDAHWLALTELHGHDTESWVIILQDLQGGNGRELSDRVPATPGNFPLLDWSANSRWLLVADRNFLRLISPQDGYQESIAHSFDACTAVAWAG